jgi:Type II secretion system protein B
VAVGPPAAPAGPLRDAAAPGRIAPRASATPPAASIGRTLWPWLAGGVLGLVVNALVLGAVLVTRPSGPTVVAPPSAAVETAESPARAEAPAPVPAVPAAPPETEPPTTKPPDGVARRRTGTDTGDGRARQRDAADAEPHSPSMPATTARPSDTALAITPPTAPARPAPAPIQPTAPARVIAPEQPGAPEPLPGRRRRAARREPGPAAAPAAPDETEPAAAESRLKMDALVWSADPEKRMVYLNGRKYVEGEALENGAVIERIVENGVVLVYRGQRFRMSSDSR